MLQSKSDFRKKYRGIRRDISLEERVKASIAAANHLARHPFFLASQRIACYMAYQEELDTGPLIQKIWAMQKICYLPVMQEDSALTFVRYDEEDELVVNQRQILEPIKGSCDIATDKLDLVIAPLLAFDKHGHRVGAGGGYYDRTFAFKHAGTEQSPILLGYAFELQGVKSLPAEPWDVKLQGVVTEAGVVVF